MAKIRIAVGSYSDELKKRLEYHSESDIFTVFPNSFMENHTQYRTFTDFCQAMNCDLTSQNDLDKLQNGDFDQSIVLLSDFDSWNDMVETAYQLLINQK